MTPAEIARTADRIATARRQGTRIALQPGEIPETLAEAMAIQDKVVAALASPIAGWKVNELPSKEVIFAPILQSGVVPQGGTWTLEGREPGGIELEIAFKMARDVPAGATGGQVLDAIGSAHVVFELCESRLTDPDSRAQPAKLADCILNSGMVVGASFSDWRSRDLRSVPGRLLVDGKVHKDGRSVDPIRAIEVLAPALSKVGRKLAAGQVVITGSLIGMNWLTGRRALRGQIDGCGEVAVELHAA